MSIFLFGSMTAVPTSCPHKTILLISVTVLPIQDVILLATRLRSYLSQYFSNENHNLANILLDQFGKTYML